MQLHGQYFKEILIFYACLQLYKFICTCINLTYEKILGKRGGAIKGIPTTLHKER